MTAPPARFEAVLIGYGCTTREITVDVTDLPPEQRAKVTARAPHARKITYVLPGYERRVRQ